MAKKMMLDEKRTKMLEVFDKYKTFFKMQELEKIGSKEKGVNEKTIKDVVLGLLYDDLICGEKVGISVFYWSNKNKKLIDDSKNIVKLEAENKEYKKKIDNLNNKLDKEKKEKKITDSRLEKIKKLQELQERVDFMTEDLEEYSDLTREEFSKINNEGDELITKINKATDNIFILQDYLSKKFNLEKKEVNKMFGINEDMDYY